MSKPEKLEILSLDIDQLDFQDRYGQWRSTRGCSLRGRESFRAYIEKLDGLIESADQTMPIAELYNSNDVFRHVCDRCLQLNNIDPDWLDGKGALLTSLLFRYEDGAGMLIRLNMVEQFGSPKSKDKGAGVADIGASILAATNDLKQALEALDHPDGKFMMQVLEARAKQIREHQSRSKNRPPGLSDWMEKRRQNAQEKGVKPVRLSDLEAKKK